jgi:hypothetical protein
MKTFVLVMCAAVALVLAAGAGATQPTHSKYSLPLVSSDTPAGDLCDFRYYETDLIALNELDYADGAMVFHFDATVTHTNLDTGYTLSEVDHFTQTFYADGSQRVVGLQWHLRDANGKIVLVQGGNVLFDPDGVPSSFTPNLNPDFAAVVCSTLGGNAA